MMTSTYEWLSFLDASFLAFEGTNTPMHIAGVAVFDATRLTTASSGVDVQRIRAYVGSRLAHFPRYRQRVAYVPIENHPIWVDDPHFDLGYHVRHASLPRPGDDLQLQELCARLLERPLARSKPLWEMWVIEGLARGRFALLMKVHHCMADGIAGVELLTALLRPTPDATIDGPTDWRPRPAPSPTQLLRDELARRRKMSIALLRRLRAMGEKSPRVGSDWEQRLKAVWQLVTASLRRPVTTPLNRRLGPHRRVHWATYDLAAFKEIRNQLGGTVNDVVLSVVSGAVRAFFARRGFAPDRVDFCAAVPVNVRSQAEQHKLGNRVSAWLVPLPIHEPRPTRRLQTLRDTSRYFKDTNQTAGTQVLMETAKWTSANLLTLGTLLLNRVQPFNMIVTNVPGPQLPLYFLDARMEAIYPQVPLFENQSLGIALFSYDGRVFWGFNGDWDALPDLDEFVKDVENSFRQLRRSARHRRRRLAATPQAHTSLLPADMQPASGIAAAPAGH